MIASSVAVAVALLNASAVGAYNYGANNLGGSTSLTWGFTAPYKGEPSASKLRRDRVVIGYACVTRDTLEGMTHDAFIHRYAITAIPHTGDIDLKPLQAVYITPAGTGFVAKKIGTPSSEEVWQRAERDFSGEWFKSDLEAEGLGKACVDGGIAAGLKYLEQVHSVSTRSNNNRTSQGSLSRTEAFLTSQNPNSPINVRDAASATSYARHIGYSGDRVIMLSSKIGNDGYQWHQIRFKASGATGWVREDFVNSSRP